MAVRSQSSRRARYEYISYYTLNRTVIPEAYMACLERYAVDQIVRAPKQIGDAIRRQRRKLGLNQPQRQGQDKATAGNHLGGREWRAREVSSERFAVFLQRSTSSSLSVPGRRQGGRDRGHLLMARPRRHIPLNVFLSGRLVGRLNRQSSGATDFQGCRVAISTSART